MARASTHIDLARADAIVRLSALFAAVSQAIGFVVYVRTQPIVVADLDLSTLQSALHNPHGYLIPAIGTLISMLLLLRSSYDVYQRFHATAPRPAIFGSVALFVSMVLFIANDVHAIAKLDLWKLHGVFARTGFGFLLVAHMSIAYAAGDRYRMHGIVGACCFFLAAIIVGFNIGSLFGASEVIYLIAFYTSTSTLLRAVEEDGATA
ncbi:MAG: hypothetical protein JSS89_10790 [Bacteroidetes bacterium]|nr:hypothetical protein [Bacteroidota bacterium]